MVIVAAVDRSDRAEKVVQEASILAEAFNDDLHVLHVLTRSEFVNLGRTAVRDSENVTKEKITKAATEIAEQATEELESPSSVIGLVGEPAQRIVKYADDQSARYIVLSGRKRSPAGKAIFGSTSQKVILNAECPVLTALR